jgi:hypothetical protein
VPPPEPEPEPVPVPELPPLLGAADAAVSVLVSGFASPGFVPPSPDFVSPSPVFASGGFADE